MKLKKNIHIIIAAFLLVLLLICELFKGKLFSATEYGESFYSIVTRFIGGLACLILLLRTDFSKIISPRTTWAKFALILPCMAVAVNNFPFIPFFGGEAYIDAQPSQILIYALVCLCVGFFEEMAFRGCIFTVILQRLACKKAGVFWSIVASSAVFGVIHLLNIAVGASPGAVILQVGYSFLIGAMCSVVLIKTGSIWYAVLLHAVYNFAGGVVPECGGGEIWTVPEIILTAVVAVIVAAYVIYMLVKIDAEEISMFLNREQIKERRENADI